MNSEHNQGLGVSVAIYLVALVCGLALFVLPVLVISGPSKFENAGMAAYEPPPGTLLIPQRARNAGPLAVLQHDDLVDPALAAELNAKAKKTEKPHQLASGVGQWVHPKAPPAGMRYAQPANSGRPYFSLF
jgi:hypothetical protein